MPWNSPGAISGYHAHLDAVLGDPDYLSSGSNLCSCGPLSCAPKPLSLESTGFRTGASQRVLLANRELHVGTRQQYLVALSNPFPLPGEGYSPVIWMPYSKGTPHLSSDESVRSEREGTALAMVADIGPDAGLGRRRRPVDLPVLAAVSRNHAGGHHHPTCVGDGRATRSTKNLIPPSRRVWTRVSSADGRGYRRAGAVDVRARRRRHSARRRGVAHVRARAAVAAEDPRPLRLPGLATLVVTLVEAAALGDAGHDREDSLPMMLLFSIELSAVVALVAILAWQSEVIGRCLLRLVVVLWGRHKSELRTLT